MRTTRLAGPAGRALASRAVGLVFALFTVGRVAVAHGQGTSPSTGGIAPGSFGTGEAKSRPEHVEEDLIGTPRDIRTVPRAPTLPDLTHRAPELSFEHTAASVKPRTTGPVDPSTARLTSHLFNFDFELPVTSWLYGGSTWGFSAARAAESDTASFVAGQPLIFARVVRSAFHEKYAIGAGLGFSPPVFSYGDDSEAARLEAGSASTLVSVVRPWDVSTFLDRRFTTRPWIDLRVAFRRFVVQARQGFDANLRSSGAACAENEVCERAGDLQLISTTTLYAAWQPRREIAVGIEAWQVYLLKTRSDAADDKRSALALSPSVRFYYRWVEPAVSLLFPVGPPLLGAADSYYALRFDLRMWFGR
ncbi:MAG: hypothetical protein HYV09_34400 [Deltaproteobacteria bacterium]|nr:hypothetical protein [Deltaproteobacteria bacterium]